MLRFPPLALLLICAQSAMAEEFPYLAVIESDEAPVRCGPGSEYYACDVLPQGTEIEVYRRDEGEWLGIRPPEGSFSWVPADKLQPNGQAGEAVVTQDGAIAWVGARVGRVSQHKWQVKLKQGEIVQIVGDKRQLASLGDEADAWYKISPPAGEFRWIHQRSVRRTSALNPLAAGQTPPAADSLTHAETNRIDASTHDHARSQGDLQLTAVESELADHQVAAADGEGIGQTRAAAGDGFVARKTAPEKGPGDAHAGNVSPLDSPQQESEIRRIELELSEMVAKEMPDWKLEPLRRQAETLIQSGQTAIDRGRARLLLDTIAQFETLQKGKTVTANKPETGDPLFVPPEAAAGASSISATSNPASNPAGSSPLASGKAAAGSAQRFEQLAAERRYDGAGWLLPVHSQLMIAPRYAITDDQGKVIQYVTPAPGRNLHRHLRKPVGIIGQRQFVPGLGAPVLTANNVVELQQLR